MSPDRANWWTHRDAQRVLARARHTSGGRITVEELADIRAAAMLILTGPVPVDPADAAQLRELLVDLEAAMFEAAEREDGAA
jgi:hypothetical protein